MHLPKPKGMQVTDLSTLVADHVRRRAHRINGCADQLTLLSLFRLRTLRTTSDQAQAWLVRQPIIWKLTCSTPDDCTPGLERILREA